MTENQTIVGELLRAQELSKSYGAVKALSAVDIKVAKGQTLAILGHNGSGKSTLLRVLSGRTRPDSGLVALHGEPLRQALTVREARRQGIRTVDQEFPLCLTLSVKDNLLIKHPELMGRRRRRTAEGALMAMLDEIFPDSHIHDSDEVSSLSVAQRQMLDIALGTCNAHPSHELSVLLLDESTSALPIERREQLFVYLQKLCRTGVGVVFVSHRLEEVIEHADVVQVLRDGSSVGLVEKAAVTRDELIRLMGGSAADAVKPASATPGGERATTSAMPRAGADRPLCVVDVYSNEHLRDVSLSVAPAEIVGLGGLDGQGQRALLAAIFGSRRKGLRRSISLSTEAAYVSGDRNGEGIFPLWTVAENISIGAFGVTARLGIIHQTREAALAKEWIDRLRIRTASADSLITELSGGSQQKALVARVLASGAQLILLDDPTRGVDIGTRAEIYELVHAASRDGRSFIWYSTDNDELRECDRVLVMREGGIVRELRGGEATDHALVAASFESGDVAELATDTAVRR